jgi:hypothetical protein
MATNTCAGTGTELQVCIRKQAGSFFHGLRLSSGSWQGFYDALIVPNSADVRNLSCGGVWNELHVCLVKTDGRFFHAIRQADGSWVGFNDGSGIPNTDNIRDLSCAGVGNELHVCLVKTDGRFFHAIRQADGSWVGFNDAFGTMGHFEFDGDISGADRNTILDHHRMALSSVSTCSNLSASELAALQGAYMRVIRHSSTTQAGINAKATLNGSQIWVNFGVLFPQGSNEIAQTLVHEMMHCAGYTHPDRRDPPTGMSCASPNPTLFDCPLDNGVYYGTPPLRAELCIAGTQSDVARQASGASGGNCRLVDGVYVVRGD